MKELLTREDIQGEINFYEYKYNRDGHASHYQILQTLKSQLMQFDTNQGVK